MGHFYIVVGAAATIGFVDALSFADARACVLAQVALSERRPAVEEVALLEAAGRVLAVPISADRDFPPLDRSVRDGFAVRSGGGLREFRVAGEVRAGEMYDGECGEGEAVEIMTGAPVPPGADSVVMVEHVRRANGLIALDRPPAPGDNVNPRGAEARRGDSLLDAGRRLGFVEIALLASVGRTRVNVYAKPRVAIVSTGDELVGIDDSPRDHQIRNSNAYSLAIQTVRAGGTPLILPAARDDWESTGSAVARGLEADLLLLSGGVSAGKYDIVESVLAEFGAEFFFDRVRVQPGQPLVFGRARDRFFFGLPGNPASTMVTFEVFARAAVEMLGGETAPRLPLLHARLSVPFRHKGGLTRFLPACLSPGGAAVTPAPWKGSSDVVALARSNAFLVAEPDRESYDAGDWIQVLLR